MADGPCVTVFNEGFSKLIVNPVSRAGPGVVGDNIEEVIAVIEVIDIDAIRVDDGASEAARGQLSQSFKKLGCTYIALESGPRRQDRHYLACMGLSCSNHGNRCTCRTHLPPDMSHRLFFEARVSLCKVRFLDQ